MFRSSLRGRLKVVAVVFARLLNTPATLSNQGGWICFKNSLLMNNELKKTELLRRKCANQFAVWLTNLPELEEWEDRASLVSEMDRVAARMEQNGMTVIPFLPSLLKMTQAVTQEVADWTEATMKKLNLDPPEYWNSQELTPLEKVQNLVALLSQAAIPLEPSEMR